MGFNIGLVIGQLTAGGAEGQLVHVARALRDSPYRPQVYCMSDQTEPMGSALAEAGVPVCSVSGPKLLRPRRLAAALDEERIDLLHSWLYIGNTYAWLANRGRRPLITSARNCKRQGVIHDMVNRLAFRGSARIVVNSRQVADYIQHEYGAPAERIAVLYNGVDVDRFRPSENGRAFEKLVVGVGRLVPQKDPEFFLEAAACLARADADVRFAFVGEGPLRAELRAAVAARGLADRFEVPGESRDVPAILQDASIFWLTSAWEGLPNVVLEAMASGVPVVATDVGGTRELLRSGREGFLIRHRDVDALVHYSRELLADGGGWHEFSRRARERAVEFAAARMATSMKRLYAEVLGDTSAADDMEKGAEGRA